MEGERPNGWPALERGSGTTIVFLHGYPLDHSMWLSQMGRLSDSHRVVLLDLPGYGLAGAWPVADTLEGFADSVHRTMHRHLPAPAVVVGHSFGGYIALQLYQRHPELFQALVLTDTRSAADTPDAREQRLATVARLDEPGESLDVEETIGHLVTPATLEADGPVVEHLRDMIRAAPPRTVRNSLKAIADRPDLTPVLPTIQVPSLVIWGEEDRLIPPRQTISMVAAIRGCAGVGIPAAAHLPSMEAPEAFASVLRNFTDRLPAT
ncbi:MAG: alpha/beta hydrolase [Thermoplasmata archaeon]